MLPQAVETQAPVNDLMLQSIADAQGFHLYRHYTEAQAAKYIGIHAATLKKLRLKGLLAFVRLGKRRVAYFGLHIAQYLINQIQPCQATKNVNINSAITGSLKEIDRLHTIERGMMRRHDKLAERLSAQRILKKPSSC